MKCDLRCSLVHCWRKTKLLGLSHSQSPSKLHYSSFGIMNQRSVSADPPTLVVLDQSIEQRSSQMKVSKAPRLIVALWLNLMSEKGDQGTSWSRKDLGISRTFRSEDLVGSPGVSDIMEVGSETCQHLCPHHQQQQLQQKRKTVTHALEDQKKVSWAYLIQIIEKFIACT